MKDLLLDRKTKVEQAKSQNQHELDLQVLAGLLRRYDEILAEGYQANPPPPAPRKTEHSKRKPGRAKQNPARNLFDRFSQRKSAVLRFLYDFAVPFDHNQAERDLRMIKVQQKVSGCLRTEEGDHDVLSHSQLSLDPPKTRYGVVICTRSDAFRSSSHANFLTPI
jgi:transposase